MTNPSASEVDMTERIARTPNVGQCEVEGCDEPMRKRQWCVSHYSQWRRTGEVKPLVRKWAPRGTLCVVCQRPVPDGIGRRKHCSAGCVQADSRSRGERPTEAQCAYCDKPFQLDRSRTGRLQRVDTKWCPDCGRDSPDVQRFKRYRVTREQYAEALARGCAICGQVKPTLHVDPRPRLLPRRQALLRRVRAWLHLRPMQSRARTLLRQRRGTPSRR